MFESNWFVPEAMGIEYGRTVEIVVEAMRLSKFDDSDENLRKVFRDNAARVYRLSC